MTTTFLDILSGIQTRLDTITGLHVFQHPPGQLTPPAAVVMMPSIESYRQSMGARGTVEFQPQIMAFASMAVHQYGQLMLAQLADITGPWSIPAAIEADRTLGGLVDDCIVTGFSTPHLEDLADMQYITGTFTLAVIYRRG